MKLCIEMLEADNGDCFIIQAHTDEAMYTIVIDGGTRGTYARALRKKLSNLSKIDAIILTHIDYDHIGGFISFFQDNLKPKVEIGCFYINTPSTVPIHDTSGKVSIQNAITLESLLLKLNIQYKRMTVEDEIIVISPDIYLDILSPDSSTISNILGKWSTIEKQKTENHKITVPIKQVERSIEELVKEGDKYKSVENDLVNASSIAFILNMGSKKLLFLGDAHPQIVHKYMKKKLNIDNKIKFECIKLSHHGSITSISKDFLSSIMCNKFLISTNGGAANHRHPSRESLAKIALLCDRGDAEWITFYTNYPIEKISCRNGKVFSWDEQCDYRVRFECRRVIEINDN